MMLLPLPDHLKELLTPYIMLRLPLTPELLLNLGLGGDARMVCAG